MKKIGIALALAVTVISAQAEEVFLASNSQGTESWFGYPETFTKIKDAYSVLVAKRYSQAGRDDERIFTAVSFSDCARGFGSLYMKNNESDSWRIVSNVSISASQTVADIIAANICNAGKEFEKNSKPVKKQTSKSV